MPFVPFHEFFPEVAKRETRSITVFHGSEWGVPAGEYGFIELYCDERKCDCRRVFFTVVSPAFRKPVAVISYGWEDPAYYARWMGGFDPLMAEEAAGATLAHFGAQSDLAPPILRLVRDLVLQDEAYVERLKKHYAMVRRYVDGALARRLDPAERKQRERLRRAKLKASRKRKARARPTRSR